MKKKDTNPNYDYDYVISVNNSYSNYYIYAPARYLKTNDKLAQTGVTYYTNDLGTQTATVTVGRTDVSSYYIRKDAPHFEKARSYSSTETYYEIADDVAYNAVTGVNEINYSSYYVQYNVYSLTMDQKVVADKVYYTYDNVDYTLAENLTAGSDIAENTLYEARIAYRKATSYDSNTTYYERVGKDQTIYAYTYKLRGQQFNSIYYEVEATVFQEYANNTVTLTISIDGIQYEKIIGNNYYSIYNYLPTGCINSKVYTYGLDNVATTLVAQKYSANNTTEFNIPGKLDTVVIKDESKVSYGAFYNCSLKSITLPDVLVYTLASNVTSANFADGTYYTRSGSAEPYTYTEATEWASNTTYYTRGNTTSTYVTALTAIGDYAFYNCTNLESASIPSQIKAIKAHAFDHCTKLTALTIPSGVDELGDYAFYHCEKIEQLTVPATVDKAKLGSYVFAHCYELEELNLLNDA